MPSAIIQDVQAGQFVARRVDSVFNAAKSLFNRVESASPIVKRSLESIDKNTEWLSRPIVSRISQVSQPVVARLDAGLASAYTQLDSRVLKPSQRLQEDLVSAAKAGKEKVATVHDLASFYQAATDALHSVAEKARAKAASPTVSFQEFLSALQARYPALSATAENRLLLPAINFYLFASAQVSGLGHRAEGVLSSALEHYRANMHLNLSVPQLVDGVRARLGSMWSDGLQQPLSDLFSNIRRSAADDLQSLSAGRKPEESIKFVAEHWVQLLQLTSDTVDTWLPDQDSAPLPEPTPAGTTEEQPAAVEPLSVAILAQRVTRRLRSRASGVITSNSSRVKSMLPADLIAYANRLVERVDSAYHPAQRVHQVRAACANSVEYGQSVCKNALSAVEARLQHLRGGLTGAVAKFSNLVNSGLERVSTEEVKAVQRDLTNLCLKTLRREQPTVELKQLQANSAALFKRMAVSLQSLLPKREACDGCEPIQEHN